MANVAIISASNGKNLELSNKLLDHAKELGAKADVLDLTTLDWPVWTPIVEQKGVPKEITKLAENMKQYDSYIFVAPEYNGSMPPCLVNFICWVSRTGEDWRELFNSKSAVIATHSGSGGAHVLMAMRQQLSYLGMNVLGRQLLTNYGKELNSDSAIACIKQII